MTSETSKNGKVMGLSIVSAVCIFMAVVTLLWLLFLSQTTGKQEIKITFTILTGAHFALAAFSGLSAIVMAIREN